MGRARATQEKYKNEKDTYRFVTNQELYGVVAAVMVK